MATIEGEGPEPISIQDTLFCTYAEALEALRNDQQDQGYVVNVANSKTSGKAKRKAATIRCQYSGSYRSWEENEGKYKTSTKKSGCLFYSNIRFHQPSQSYRVTFKVNSHCHEPLFAPAASALIRQRSQRKFGIERLYRLVETYSSNAANMRKDIAEATQRDHPEVLINDRDVGYIQRQLRLQRYGGTTSTQAFLDVLLAAKADGEVAFFAVDRGPNGKMSRRAKGDCRQS
ncbi:hypothetical protein HRG_012255 [Hirsutella rhossiliensis]